MNQTGTEREKRTMEMRTEEMAEIKIKGGWLPIHIEENEEEVEEFEEGYEAAEGEEVEEVCEAAESEEVAAECAEGEEYEEGEDGEEATEDSLWVHRAKLPHGWLVKVQSAAGEGVTFVPFATDGTGWGAGDNETRAIEA